MLRRRRDLALGICVVALLVAGNGFVAGQDAVGVVAVGVALIALVFVGLDRR